jgi:hypothetical protein
MKDVWAAIMLAGWLFAGGAATFCVVTCPDLAPQAGAAVRDRFR